MDIEKSPSTSGGVGGKMLGGGGGCVSEGELRDWHSMDSGREGA